MAGRPLIQVATDLQAQARVGGQVPVPHDTGLETAFGSLGTSLKHMGDEVGKLADKAAKSEGEADGRPAGLDPEFRTRPDRTIYSEAFNRAGLDIAETRLRTVVDQQLEAAHEKHANNPTELNRAIGEVSQGVLEQTPDELKPKLGLSIQSKALTLMRTAQRAQVAETRASQTAALQEDIGRSLRGISQRSFGLGLDGEADKAVAGEIAALEQTLTRKGVDGKLLVAPDRARKIIEGARMEVLQGRLLGAFDRLEGPDAKAKFIADFEEDWKNSRGVAKDLDLDQMIGLRRQFDGELRREAAGRGTGNKVIENQIRGFQKLAEEGYAPAPEEIARVKAFVTQAGDANQAAALETAEATLRFQQGARRMHPSALDAHVVQERERLSKESGTPADLARLTMAEKLLGEMRRGLKEDPNEWASRVGVVPLAPIDFSSPQALAKSLGPRIAGAQQVGEMYDQDPVYFRPDEKRKLIGMAAPGGAALTDVVDTIVRGAGPQSDAILRELWSDAPTLATLGGHASQVGRTAVAADVADGVALMRTKDFKNLAPTASKAREWAASAHGGSLNGMPKTEQALIDTTNYAYGVRLQRTGKTEDEELWQKTFREVAGERSIEGVTYGGVAKWRGRSVMIPPDVRQDHFDDLMREIRIDDFGEDPPRNKKGAATAAELRGAALVPTGNGKFRLNVGDEDTPVWLGDRSGRPFVLDLKELKPKLIERRPELYLDGKRKGRG